MTFYRSVVLVLAHSVVCDEGCFVGAAVGCTLVCGFTGARGGVGRWGGVGRRGGVTSGFSMGGEPLASPASEGAMCATSECVVEAFGRGVCLGVHCRVVAAWFGTSVRVPVVVSSSRMFSHVDLVV